MSKLAVVTGAGGLVGSEAVSLLIQEGYEVFGIENNHRAHFFGPEGSTADTTSAMQVIYGERFHLVEADIRDSQIISAVFRRRPEIIIHTAAQPSHDWAAKDPHEDFGVNAVGTLTLLQQARQWCPEATFAHISTSKVYGDRPNFLPLEDQGNRFDLPYDHQYWRGIDTTMSVDTCLHSLFGVSKLSGDLLVQEYGRYFDMPTVCFRPGCVTGPGHAGVELHGFLAYLMKCAVTGRPYTVYGYEGKQVRCNIYARDLAAACLAYHENPGAGEVYNIGGARYSNCSMLEAISMCEDISGNKLEWSLDPKARIGDHRWWISSNASFEANFPKWKLTRNVPEMLQEIHDAGVRAWTA